MMQIAPAQRGANATEQREHNTRNGKKPKRPEGDRTEGRERGKEAHGGTRMHKTSHVKAKGEGTERAEGRGTDLHSRLREHLEG